MRPLLRWFWRVTKKGFWILGFLPTLLDYIATYVPARYIPGTVSTFLRTGASLRLSLILVAIGVLISAYLVHLETEATLAAYEYQAPEYELEVQEVRSELCQKDVVHIECDFSMRGLNPWRGYLGRIAVAGENRVKGLAGWEVEDVCRRQRDVYVPISPWPFPIPQSESQLRVTLHARVQGSVNPEPRAAWGKVEIPLRLLVEYDTQPAGHVQKLVPLEVQADLGKELDAIVASQRLETA